MFDDEFERQIKIVSRILRLQSRRLTLHEL